MTITILHTLNDHFNYSAALQYLLRDNIPLKDAARLLGGELRPNCVLDFLA